ncbi:MAG: sialidase family protein [Planctomycetota bacterium]
MDVWHGFVCESPPTRRSHAATIAETPRGLVASWFGGTSEGRADVVIWLARHEGGRWCAPVQVADGVQPDGRPLPTWNPVLAQPANGPLLLFYRCGPSPRRWWSLLRTSADGGATWGAPVRLPAGVLGPIRCKPIELADGALLCGSSTERGGWRVHFERTLDLGATWRATPSVAAGRVGAIQPTLLRGDDGEILALCRTNRGRVGLTTSADGGGTWSPLSLLDLPNPNSGIDAVTLADGTHLLVYNPSRFRRTPLHVAISRDGRDWRPVAVLEDARGEFSYPAVMQAASGAVHVVYTWRRRRIRHAVLDSVLG